MYEKLIAELREYWNDGTEDLRNQAADAIEELQKQLREEKVDNVNLTGWLAEEHANQCPHYTRNVHDRGDDSLCDKWVCEVKSLPKWIPVAERLPEEDGWYQVYAPDYSGGSSSGLKNINGNMYSAFKNGKWSIEVGYYKRPGCVKAWMPLPPPPKEET